MYKQILIPICITLLLFFGCTKHGPLISEEELIVVWAYLYAGEPVTSIKLTSTVPLNADTTDAPPINNATITLIKNGQHYDCEPSPGDSGYYHYSGDELTIETGDEFMIEIEQNDQFVTAQITVPEAPSNVNISSSEMTLPDFENRESLWEWRESENREVTITWDNEENAFYYVTLKNVEENPVAINSWKPERLRQFVFPPISDNSYRIRMPSITHLGEHCITVFKVNQEYVDLYESRNQDSRDLNEPLTNIENGLGVFSALNGVSMCFTVIQG
ncbi:MAG: DUF4249 family protein [Candidatus Marinimicrobia bacterium]|nr:DUF4249 family protein [Candidatus Neomarinimicrobiota bacterium]